ncbi:MAG TPA: bifunctional oligoribonuclease/PAP phosphatase NrnA [Moorella mulderi]|nr:bifunctional oligoribonuclease/PAP phosphatase NrnA [Moorella mulderi]
MESIKAIARILLEAPYVGILSHDLPDGDCLGSSLALALALRARGARVVVINADPVPEAFRFLPGQDTIVSGKEIESPPPILVVLDSADLQRPGEGMEHLLASARIIINIDHHVSNTRFGHLNLVDVQASATAQLVYRLLKEMGLPISGEIATCLYTGLVTDTGSFQYENTTPEALRLAAELMELGADVATIREYLWERKPLASLKLLSLVLPTLNLAYGGEVAWMVVSQESLEKAGAGPEHVEGLVNYPRSLAGVEVAFLFRELSPRMVKVSLRSKKRVDVNRIASLFGGGGHRRAAGCVVEGSLEEVIPRVVAAAGEALR